MSFLAKLQELKQNTKVNIKNCNNNNKSNELNKDTNVKDDLPTNYVREVDPAIKRLKEARRLKKGEPTKAISKKSSMKSESLKNEMPIYRNKPGLNTSQSVAAKVPKKNPMKKLTFNELMEQAEKKAKQKQNGTVSASAHNLKTDTTRKGSILGSKDARKKSSPAGSLDNKCVKQNQKFTSKSKFTAQSQPVFNTNTNIAKPNAKLAKVLKLKEKRKTSSMKYVSHENEDFDDALSDFIENDEDGLSNDPNIHSYDRDEIWSIFNKGKKRYYESDFSDDNMEANEMEILEEEEYAEKMAKLEDKREELWLKRHERKKKERKS